MLVRLSQGIALLATLALLSGCSLERREQSSSRAAQSTIPTETLAAMDSIGTDRNQPILIRAFKKESEIEIWKRTRAGTYALMKTYPVCRWSGRLGPKTREGDRQVPEGFYTVTPGQMNPNSAMWPARCADGLLALRFRGAGLPAPHDPQHHGLPAHGWHRSAVA